MKYELDGEVFPTLLGSRHSSHYPALRALKSFALGFFTCSLGSVLAFWITQADIHGALAFFDNLVMGAAAGIIVLFYDRRRQRELDEKLRTMRLMNHHVRNALQVISAASCKDDADQARVRGAVERIEWALREVLPGRLKK
jgi:hypothetical protein